MSAHSPQLQFVTKVKEVVLVRGLWHVTPGSPWMPFDMDQSISFPSLFEFDGSHFILFSFILRSPVVKTK